MARKVHIPVIGRLDRAAGVRQGTMTIDRAAGLITVRPRRSRKTYTLCTDRVADWVVSFCIRAELVEKRKRKREGKLQPK